MRGSLVQGIATQVRKNVTIDWTVREIRALVTSEVHKLLDYAFDTRPPPPILAATLISLESLLKILPRLASRAPL